MLQPVNEDVANSLRHVAEAEDRAQAVADPNLKAEYEQMAKGWRILARSYEFQNSLGRFIAVQTSSNAGLEASNSEQDHYPAQGQQAGTVSNKSWIATSRARILKIWNDEKPLSLLAQSLLVVLLYLAAVLGREVLRDALDLSLPGAIRYLTFFPALLAAGLLCGLVPSLMLLAAFAATGIFFLDPSNLVPIPIRLAIGLLFAVGGGAVVIPSWYAARTQRILRAQDRRLALLNGELRHRVKNLFALTCSICNQSAHGTSNLNDVISHIIGRIQAIATAQDYLSITSDQGSDLRALTEAIIGPLCPDAARLQIRGPSFTLPPTTTTSFALILHELATNAVKYGAWQQSSPQGRIEVAWYIKSSELLFHWRETGVPTSPPKRQGFGTTVISRSLREAQVEHLFHPDGVECTIRL